MREASFSKLSDSIAAIRRFAGVRLLTNVFGAPQTRGDLPAVRTEKAVLFLDADRDFHHVMFAAADLAALDEVLAACPSGIYALDYLCKTFPPDLERVFVNRGFVRRAHYQRLSGVLPEINPLKGTAEFARGDEAEIIHRMMPGLFDRYLDHLPLLAQLREMIEDRRVIVKRLKGEIVGLYVFQIQGQRAHLNYWWSSREAGSNAGLELLIRACTVLKERGVKWVHAWINSSNQPVISIHRFFGLAPDGLQDYIFFRGDSVSASPDVTGGKELKKE